MYRYILLIFCFVIFNTPLFSQENTEDKSSHFILKVKETDEEKKKNPKNCSFKKIFINTDINILIGATQFYGDIKQFDFLPAYEGNNNFFEIQPAIEISFTKRLSQLLLINASLVSGKFGGLKRDQSGEDYTVYEPYPGFYEGDGEYFITNFREVDAQLMLDLSNANSFFRKSQVNNYTLYLKAGIGLNSFNSLNRNLNGNYIYSYGYEEGIFQQNDGFVKKNIFDSPRETVYLYGLLTKYDITEKYSILLDITKRKANTDLWDSHNNHAKDDYFIFYSVGLSYNIGGKSENEEWVTPLEGLQKQINIQQANIEWISEDKDNDGVADAFDKELNTPVGVAVSGSGASLDVDMDNVPDYLDSDPFSSRGAMVDLDGVEFDTDNDGIPDSKDLESNTEIGSIVNQYGISVSSSGIGTDTKSYLPSIYFESGSYYINNSNLKRLSTIAIIMNNNPNIKLNVIGNADNIGTSTYNQKLALNRANEIINFLSRNFNIDKNRFTAISNGEEKPLAKENISTEFPNINTLSEINRRVDFQIIQ